MPGILNIAVNIASRQSEAEMVLSDAEAVSFHSKWAHPLLKLVRPVIHRIFPKDITPFCDS